MRVAKLVKYWRRFAHLRQYARNNSDAGNRQAKREGYPSQDLDWQVTKDNVIINTHWGDTREFERRKRKWKDVTWAEAKKMRALHGGYKIRKLEGRLKVLKRLGFTHFEFEAKDGHGHFAGEIGRANFQLVKDLCEKYGIRVIVKSLTSIPGCKDRLRAAKAVGLPTLVLGRGRARKTMRTEYAGIADYFR